MVVVVCADVGNGITSILLGIVVGLVAVVLMEVVLDRLNDFGGDGTWGTGTATKQSSWKAVSTCIASSSDDGGEHGGELQAET